MEFSKKSRKRKRDSKSSKSKTRKIQNILYICADDITADLEIPKFQQYIQKYIRNPHRNYYIGNLNSNDDNKCDLLFGKGDIDECNFNILFDIIVLEGCPINDYIWGYFGDELYEHRFLTNNFFKDVKKISKSDVKIFVLPLFLKEHEKYENLKKLVIKDFDEHSFILQDAVYFSQKNDGYKKKSKRKSKSRNKRKKN